MCFTYMHAYKRHIYGERKYANVRHKTRHTYSLPDELLSDELAYYVNTMILHFRTHMFSWSDDQGTLVSTGAILHQPLTDDKEPGCLQ